MVFTTRHEARIIHRSLYNNTLSTSANPGPNLEGTRTDEEVESDDDDIDDINEQDNDSDGSEPNSNKTNDDSFVHPSSEQAFGCIENTLGLIPTTAAPMEQKNTRPILADLSNTNISQNSAAIRKQELDVFFASTARSLHALITSASFQQAQNLVEAMSEARNPRKHPIDTTGILPLERETKQRRHPSYSSL